MLSLSLSSSTVAGRRSRSQVVPGERCKRVAEYAIDSRCCDRRGGVRRLERGSGGPAEIIGQQPVSPKLIVGCARILARAAGRHSNWFLFFAFGHALAEFQRDNSTWIHNGKLNFDTRHWTSEHEETRSKRHQLAHLYNMAFDLRKVTKSTSATRVSPQHSTAVVLLQHPLS